MTSIYYCLYTIYNTSSTTIRSRILSFFFFQCSAPHPDLHSFPTRRSSDLEGLADGLYVDARAEHFTQPGYDRYWQYVREFNLTALPYLRRNRMLCVLQAKLYSEDDMQSPNVLKALVFNQRDVQYLARHARRELPSLN